MFLLLFAATSVAAADSIVLVSGEVIDGSLQELADGVIVFQTALAGVMVLPADEVRGLSTKDFWTVWFENGERRTGRFEYRRDTSYLAGPEGGPSDPLLLVDIDRAAPASAEAATVIDEGAGSSWSLEVDLGYHWRWGARDYGDPYAAVRFELEEEAWSLDSAARAELGGANDFPEFLLARMDWRFDLTEHYYAALGGWLERDRREAIRWRSDVHAGVGREIWDDDYQRLRVEAGPALTVASFDPYRLPESIPWRRGLRPLGGDFEAWSALAYYSVRDHRQDETEFGLLLRLTYDREILWNGTFQEDLTVLPSLSSRGDLRARSESRVLFPMTTRLTLKFDLLLDYERNRPYRGLDPWRTTVGAGFVLDF